MTNNDGCIRGADGSLLRRRWGRGVAVCGATGGNKDAIASVAIMAPILTRTVALATVLALALLHSPALAPVTDAFSPPSPPSPLSSSCCLAVSRARSTFQSEFTAMSKGSDIGDTEREWPVGVADGSDSTTVSEGDLSQARATIADLEARAGALKRELAMQTFALKEASRERDRVVAEHEAAVSSHVRLEASMKSDRSKREEKLLMLNQEATALRAKITDVRESMDRHYDEARELRDKCAASSDELQFLPARLESLRQSVERLEAKLGHSASHADEAVASGRDAERQRSQRELDRAGAGWEARLRRKVATAADLRPTLREANAEKRRAVKRAGDEVARAVKDARLEYSNVTDELRATIEEREGEIERMGRTITGAEGAREEAKKLGEDVVNLTKSIEDLLGELDRSALAHNCSICDLEDEAASKNQRIRSLENDLNAAYEKIGRLESRIEELTSDLEEERQLGADLAATAAEVRALLDEARAEAGGYEDVVAVLREEAEAHRAQLSRVHEEAEPFKRRTAELEDLMQRTKKSIATDKKRVADALEKSQVRIAVLDRKVADQFDAVYNSEVEIEDTESRLQIMAGKYDGKRQRADTLDRKIQKLNQLSNRESPTVLEEVDRLTVLLEDVVKSNEEYKSLLKTQSAKSEFLSRRLLMSERNASDKQGQISRLKKELSDTLSRMEAATASKRSASEEALSLKAQIEEVQSGFTARKAQANCMIAQLTNDLKEKDELIEQARAEVLKTDQADLIELPHDDCGKSKATALEEEFSRLKSEMEEVRSKARERIKDKNKSLKELEDDVVALTSQVEDLRRGRGQISMRLEEELRRSRDAGQGRKQQLREAEEKIARDHAAEMKEAEAEINRSIARLEGEIDSLKSKSRQGGTTDAAENATDDQRKIVEVEKALQRIKQNEISLTSANIKMQHRIEDLQLQAQVEKALSTRTGTINESVRDTGTESERRHRPIVIRFVANTWKKLFRRQKL
ncbi:hypothetical protein ACHAWF_015306 [Thalassiosira exigua]